MEGMITIKDFPAAAKAATLTVRLPSYRTKEGAIVGEMPVIFHLAIGKLHPLLQPAPDELSLPGVKQRLGNLGFDCMELTEQITDLTEFAIRAFCKTYGIPERNLSDASFREKLHEVHDHPKKATPPVKEKR
jgi:hypothetical protein